ncbi:CMRF35-like molecule 6 [Vidua macroura]|uniref:CMRF35-like molecule 6 n=1 Tax=Vidua macroura TaxID=187451 RepID=UPI0023A7E5FB|nr:CMRF35-like molecule 6 [Vidua macroura]
MPVAASADAHTSTEAVAEAKEEAKPQRHNEEEQQGCPDAYTWLLLVLASALLPDIGAVTGPSTVQGFLRETLSVTCTYQPSQETLPKFCCKPSTCTGITCATYIVSTSKLQPEVQQGRFSILNSCALRAFRVTVERLVKEDAGMLRCGMQKGFSPLHEGADAEVIITPGRSLHVLPIATVTPTLGGRGQTAEGGFTPSVTGTQGPSGTRCIHPSSAPATPTLSPDTPQETGSTFRYFPVLAGLQLLALLAMSAPVLWVSLWGR